MDALITRIGGIGWWSPGVADWPAAAQLLAAGADWPSAAGGTPAAAILAASERRRAPLPVRIACEVAAQACAMAGRDPSTLPCVFTSMHGDLTISDAMCSTLARAPAELSPTRFHNSVLNAAVGYWTIASGCQASSTALSAWQGSLAAGLLEAASEVLAEGEPVLLVACDIDEGGALARLLPTGAAHGLALVLLPEDDAASGPRLHLSWCGDQATAATVDPTTLARRLLAELARPTADGLRLPAGPGSRLAVAITP